MTKPETRPGALWKLLGTALALEVQGDAEEGAVRGAVTRSVATTTEEEEGGLLAAETKGAETKGAEAEAMPEAVEVEGSSSSSSSSLSEWSESRVAAAASSLLRWERPELLFAYLGKLMATDLHFTCIRSSLTATGRLPPFWTQPCTRRMPSSTYQPQQLRIQRERRRSCTSPGDGW